MTVAAFFDMDHTLLRVDTATSWTKFLRRRGELPASLLAKAALWSALYKLALLDMDTVFTRLCEGLRGGSEQEMIDKSALFFRELVEHEIAPLARARVEQHRSEGHLVVLATGSTCYAARPVAAAVGIEHLLSSELEVDSETGSFTGRPRALCFGRHKVSLADRWAQEHGVDLTKSYFYSDSYNDLPLLERVGTPVAINPDARLARHARLRGWPVERWR